ncbi:phenylacetate-coenzyme A ligase [Vulcanimicrobium alpinum]|uniref:Phenylacetate-coenzyme A ligase n=1 Tax=Vulcanimicrobium alpinum TaxID=3016050 RepID=A0AAN2CA41_UNVUL|nr:phenylacetate--CoA ligase [Vulcanimicrobium alpinum]BDE07245.1 phenylacetate-coenzyme A ligase [Vulcanimicrobium alpinum]
MAQRTAAIFQPEFETLERHALEALQFERLQSLVERLRDANAIYRERLRGVAAPRSLDDLARLPFSTKADMRDAYPLGLLAVPERELARIHASSGTTGTPTVGAYTRHDLAVFGEVMARSLAAGGIAPGDMVQVAWGYGLFTGGLGAHGGCEKLGACAIPASSGNTARQMQLLEDLPVIGIGATPSYALVLAERFRNERRRPRSLRYAICGAEAWTPELRASIEDTFGVVATNIYGLTEIIGPGVAQECLEKRGMHVQEDHFLAEIVDPDTGLPVPDGTRGELVLTTLTREAMPVLRYRTRDLTARTRERCSCGRTTARIDWFTGRVDDMLVIRGVNVFPSAVEHALLAFAELTPNYRIVVERPPNGLDTMLVEVEYAPGAAFDDRERFAAQVTHRLAEALLVSLEVQLLEPGTIERIEAGKAKRVYDRRTL